jgi:hypothetical protein
MGIFVEGDLSPAELLDHLDQQQLYRKIIVKHDQAPDLIAGMMRGDLTALKIISLIDIAAQYAVPQFCLLCEHDFEAVRDLPYTWVLLLPAMIDYSVPVQSGMISMGVCTRCARRSDVDAKIAQALVEVFDATPAAQARRA